MNNLIKANSFIFSDGLDANFLQSNYNGNIPLAAKIFHVFLSSAEEDLKKLEYAVDTSNYYEMYQISHRVKNNYMYVGLTHLSKLYHEFEKLAKDHSPETQDIFDKIEKLSMKEIPLVKIEMGKINFFISQ